jgi:hypothetical protein
MYLHATGDPRVGGVVLLNPWVRSEAGLARTRIKHYYGQRLMQRQFWNKLLTGKLNVAASLRGLLGNVRKAREKASEVNESSGQNRALSFRDRMAEGLKSFRGEVLLILSGQDYTAKEFITYADADPAWSGWLNAGNVSRADLTDADHTFSTTTWRENVENETLQWLARIQEQGRAIT